MISTFLFDLDGTLLPLDMEEFIKIYFGEMAIKLKNHIPPDKITSYVWEATNFMVDNIDPNITNEEAFAKRFTEITNIPFKKLVPIFEEFYNKEFLNVKKATQAHPLVKEIIQILKEKEYDMIIATNPLFPKEAIFHRIDWAGLNKEDFKLITSYEIMHACKPQLQYYQELMDKIRKQPEECIMIGNDVQEDMIAGELGITTFLLEDHIIHREDSIPSYNYKGSYNDLKKFIIENF